MSEAEKNLKRKANEEKDENPPAIDSPTSPEEESSDLPENEATKRPRTTSNLSESNNTKSPVHTPKSNSPKPYETVADNKSSSVLSETNTITSPIRTPNNNSPQPAACTPGIQPSSLGFETLNSDGFTTGSSFGNLTIHSRNVTPIISRTTSVGADSLKASSQKLFPITKKESSVFGSFNSDQSDSVFGGFAAFSSVPSVFSSLPSSSSGSWLDSPGKSSFSKVKGSAFNGDQNNEDEEDGAGEGEADSTEFTPIVNLVQQEVKTGEESEVCVFQEYCKLFNLSDNDWRERGKGQIKLLSSNDKPASYRLVMRTDGAPRLILNVRVMNLPVKLVGDQFVRFCGMEDTLQNFLVKFKNAGLANDFVRMVEAASAEGKKVAATSSAEKKD
ncbi:hypothetical protein HK098_004427 [Nowakowskiella sp. JEL0407]|nr:hypothetical protein HK098_004427 [Nowakowskiella sp. JEL0407]